MPPISSASAALCDPGLVVAARAGDREAFGVLYEHYARMVHGVLAARVPYDQVDDLVQEVFLAALQRLATLRAPAAFPGWLAAIARNRALDRLRETAADPLPADICSPDPGPEEDAGAVLAAIQSLPDAYRETLTLRLVEGMTGPEIAAECGLTPASVRVNLHRGMRLLRAKLDAHRTRHEGGRRDEE